jgi:thymidylate kinase
VLIAVVGADGAGKSTVTSAVRDRVVAAGYPARRLDRWDIVGNPAYPTARFLTPDQREVRSCTARMSSSPRLLFLLWAAAMALLDGRPGPAAGEITLMDGYWMKHAASEVAYGLDRTWVEQVALGLPRPDLTIHLRVPPETAWQRKDGRPFPYECAMDLTCSRTSFLAHQRAIHELLDHWAARYGWLTVDATQPLSAVVDVVVRQILEAGTGEGSRPCG